MQKASKSLKHILLENDGPLVFSSEMSTTLQIANQVYRIFYNVEDYWNKHVPYVTRDLIFPKPGKASFKIHISTAALKVVNDFITVINFCKF